MDIVNKNINRKIEAASAPFGRRCVFGEGPVGARILLLGEAPGASEEREGRPFCGAAGKNLDEFLNVLGISRGEIYITNTVKIRPCKINPKTGREINRPPLKQEIAAFSDILAEEIRAVSPGIIVTLGNTALRAVCGEDKKIGKLHGRLITGGEFPVFPLYHPAAVIYRRTLKEEYIADLHKLKKELGI